MAGNERQPLQWKRWIRSGEYVIKRINGIEYITPVPESGFILYSMEGLWRKKGSRKPDENYLVQKLLNLDTSDLKAILDFTNQFGLLGLMQHNHSYAGRVEFEGGFRYFISHHKTGELGSVYELTDVYQISLDDYVSGKYKYEPIWSEPLSAFVNHVTHYQKIGQYIVGLTKCQKQNKSSPLRALLLKEGTESFKKLATNGDKDEIVKDVSRYVGFEINRNISSIRRSILPDYTGKWSELWGFDSLLGAAYFLLSQDLAGNYWIGQCPRCNSYFISSVGTQIHCSRKCEDAARKAKSRKKLIKGGLKDGKH